MALPAFRGRSLRDLQFSRSYVLSGLLAAVALIIPIVGSLLINDDSGIDGVNGLVEALSGRSSSLLGDLGLLAPLGFAFAAGMVSAVNPCGFAMLPAYLGLYLGSGQEEGRRRQPGRPVGQSPAGGAGGHRRLCVAVRGRLAGHRAGRPHLRDKRPALGGPRHRCLPGPGKGPGWWVVASSTPVWPARAASRLGDPGNTNVKGYFIFGLSYGTASLSCTLPIFLAVVGTSLAVSYILTSLWTVPAVRPGHGSGHYRPDSGNRLLQGGDGWGPEKGLALCTARRLLVDGSGRGLHRVLLAYPRGCDVMRHPVLGASPECIPRCNISDRRLM